MNTDTQNINEIRLKPYKKEFPYSYSCGVFPTCELAQTRPDALKKLLLTDKALENTGVKKLIKICEENGVPVAVDEKTSARIYPKENVYAIGVFEKYKCKLDTLRNHIVLVNPSDMGNLGTIIRTMAAFEIFDLAVITPAADIFDPKVIRASMGAFFRLRIACFTSFEKYISSLNAKGLSVDGEGHRELYPFMLNGTPMEHITHDSGCFSLILGNESRGLPESFINIGNPVRINHASTVDSLNLPVAAAIGIYYFTQHKRL